MENNDILEQDISELEFSESFALANEALVAADNLVSLESEAKSLREVTTVFIAATNYANRYSVQVPALEEDLFGNNSIEGVQRTKIKEIADRLVAMAKQIFSWMLSWMRTQHIHMPRYAQMCRQYVTMSEQLTDRRNRNRVTDRGLLLGLSIDGLAPKRLSLLVDSMVGDFEKHYKAISTDELSAVLKAAKSKDRDAFLKASKKLHTSLLSAAKGVLKQINGDHPAIRRRSDNSISFASDASFGQNYITVNISKEVNSSGTFEYSAPLSRDANMPLRAMAYEPIPPTEIRAVCKSILTLTEKVLEHSDQEDVAQKLLRDATYLVNSSGGVNAIPALRNFATCLNNQYFTYLRFSVRNMKLIMRYCRLSMDCFERAGE